MSWRIAIVALGGAIVGGLAGGGPFAILGGLLGFIVATVSLGEP